MEEGDITAISEWPPPGDCEEDEEDDHTSGEEVERVVKKMKCSEEVEEQESVEVLLAR